MSALVQSVDPSWLPVLKPLEERLSGIEQQLVGEAAAGRQYAPASVDVFRALTLPLADVRVLIIGQDPYPTAGHAMGLAFSVHPTVRPLPKSLANIFTELADDLDMTRPTSGDLSAWHRQGVLLLNRVLTVQIGDAGSHRKLGWQSITDAIVSALVARERPLVAVLWGNDARAIKPLLADTPTVESAHPSPLSVHRGFFGSRPFSRVNALLRQQGALPIDWNLSA